VPELNPRQLRRRLAVIVPSFFVAFLAVWILLDLLMPAGGCAFRSMITGNADAMASDCTVPRVVASTLYGVAAMLIAMLLVAMPLKALMRRIEARENG
jgi:membrane associated rhomboid family serine protease